MQQCHEPGLSVEFSPSPASFGEKENAVARTRMALDGTLPEPFDLQSIEFPAGTDVAHFESQQAKDVHEAERVNSVDGERADEVGERPDAAHHLLILGLNNQKKRGPQADQINLGTTERTVGIVRTLARRPLTRGVVERVHYTQHLVFGNRTGRKRDRLGKV